MSSLLSVLFGDSRDGHNAPLADQPRVPVRQRQPRGCCAVVVADLRAYVATPHQVSDLGRGEAKSCAHTDVEASLCAQRVALLVALGSSDAVDHGGVSERRQGWLDVNAKNKSVARQGWAPSLA